MGKFLTSLFLLTFIVSHNQFSQIRGRVIDAVTGGPVPGANITHSGAGEGTAALEDGTFEIELSGRLTITAIGYSTEIIDALDEKDFYTVILEPVDYELQEVVVEAFNRSRRLVDVPGSLTLIRAEQIEREKPVTIVPLLNQAPGVFAHSGALNTSRITIRGIGARVPYATGKVRAYLNNIPLTNGSGISIVEDIDPTVMERVEIIKGPATSVYGAGLGGTIIITARKPLMMPASLSNNFQTGSWDLFRNTLSLDTGRENAGLSLRYNHTQSSGYRQNNQYRRDGLTLISQANPGKRMNLTFLMAYTNLKAHIPSSIDSLTYVTQPRSAARNWLQTRGYENYEKILGGLSAQYNFTSSITGSLSLFSTINDEMEMRPFDVLFEDRKSAGTRMKLTWSRPVKGGSLQILGGTELFTENFRYTSYENIGGAGEKGEMISDNKENISYYNLFAQADLDIDRLKFSAGVNLNSSGTDYKDLYHTEGLNPSGRYSYGNIVSPRISANYRYFQSNSVFMTVSHGYSPPSLAETLTPEGYINPDILPETSWNLEGGFRGNILNNLLFYDLNIYRMRVTDLLVAERVGEDAWVGRNAGESVHRGIEAEFQIILFRDRTGNTAGWWHPAEISVQPNFMVNNFRFTDFIDNEVDYSGNRLPGIPEWAGNAGIYGKIRGGLYGLVNFRHVGRMQMNDANSRQTKPYSLTNITIGYENLIFKRFHADAFISAGNVFDEKYASMILINAPSFQNRPPRYYYPGAPVNFSTGIKIRYHFN
jgi:iron complex outermembrane recepter protein